MTLLLRLAVRNVARHPWRSAATVLGVALGIAAVFATLSVGANVEANVRSTLEAAAGKADLLVTPGAQGRAVFAIDEVLELVRTTPGVERVYPVLNFRAEPLRELEAFERSVIPGVDSGFQLSGRITEAAADLPATLSEGSLPAAGSHGIALSAGFAATRDIRIGDRVAFAARSGEIDLTVTGLLDDSLGLPSTNGGRVGIVHLADLQEALRLPGRASFLEVLLADDARLEEARAQLEARLPESYAVTLPAGSGNLPLGIIETIQAGLSILAITLLGLGGFMAYNTFMASVVERTREYALLRTIALTRKQIRTLAIAEALVVSVLGIAVGLLLGVVLALLLTRVNALSFGFEVRTLVVPWTSILLAAFVGVAVSLIAAVLPARSAANTPPLVAVRAAEDTEPPAGPSLWGWLALLTAVAAATIPWPGLWSLPATGVAIVTLFLGVTLTTRSLLPPALRLLTPLLGRLFGAAGRLGASFTMRNSARNGVAIGTVIVGMALTIGVGSTVAGINRAILDWVDTTIVGDMFVTSPVSFPADFPTQVVAAVPEIDAVSGVGIRVVRFAPEGAERGRSVALILVDPERFDPEDGFGRFQFIQGHGDSASAYQALRQGGAVLAANTIHDRFGIGRGDIVSLRTSEGFREFPVAGVVVDFTGGGEAFVASIHDSDLFGGGSPDLFVMTVKPGVDPAAARERLLAAFPDLYLDITLNQGYRQRILALTQQSFASTNALLVLAVIIAALGVANTLGMNLASRQHEVAVLRTVGLTRRGVRQLVSSEGIVIVVVGTILGIGAGLLLSRVITAGTSALTGYVLAPHFPWRLLLLALLASPVVGLLAALFPARRAARLEPVAALAGDG